MKTKLFLLMGFICGCGFGIKAQEKQQKDIHWQGFVDVYYAYDFNEPDDHIRQPFLYNHNRHNEINLNLGIISGTYSSDKLRAKLALQVGTYAQDNYSTEQELLKNIFEAHVGIALNKSNNFWLDAGILPSHIGFENAMSTENLTLTRSLLAENSPYFLSGAQLTYDPNEVLTLALLITNGWQRIARVNGNQTPGIGTQVNYHPSDHLSLNWSTFIGSDTSDPIVLMRYFNNLYVQSTISEVLEIIIGFDIGIQENQLNHAFYDTWYTPIVIGRFQLDNNLYLAARAEYYADEEGVIIEYGAPVGFRTFGFSLNLDYEVTDNTMFRIEGRHLNSPGDIFQKDAVYISSNTSIITSLAINF